MPSCPCFSYYYPYSHFYPCYNSPSFNCSHYFIYFIVCRGGDFFRRQAAGEHPKQLNYSRAFGGKDLKMFGLSVEPDISHFEITPEGE